MFLNASKIASALGVYGFDGINACLRECVRYELGAESEFVESLASEHGKTFKEYAIGDFSMMTGIDVEPAMPYHLGNVIIKPDGMCSDGAIIHAICRFADRKKEELQSCHESQKAMIAAQYGMLVSNTTKCHVIQWNDITCKIETIKFSQKFINDTQDAISFFVDEVEQAINTDSKRHLTPIDNSAKAKKAKERYQKAQANLASAIIKLNDATAHINGLCKDEPINVAGLLLTPTPDGVRIK